jgi:hypothetical protein
MEGVLEIGVPVGFRAGEAVAGFEGAEVQEMRGEVDDCVGSGAEDATKTMEDGTTTGLKVVESTTTLEVLGGV